MAIGIIEINNVPHRWQILEQTRFGGKVCLCRAVIIIMIAAKVGKHRRVETAPPYPLLVQRMARDLHDSIVDVGLHHLRQQRVELERIRSGVRGREMLYPQAIIDRTDHPHGLAGCLQNRFDDIRGCRLAVRSRDPNQAQVSPRMPIVRTGEAGERLATIGHLDHRAARLLRALLQGRRALFHHQRRGTLSERFVEKAPADVVEAEREKLERYRRELDALSN